MQAAAAAHPAQFWVSSQMDAYLLRRLVSAAATAAGDASLLPLCDTTILSVLQITCRERHTTRAALFLHS